MNRLGRLIAGCCFVCALAATGGWAQEPGQSGTKLVVATRHVPPFAIENKDGSWSGLSVELWRKIAEKYGWRTEWKKMKLGTMLEAIENRQVDSAVAALSPTAKRERVMDFTHPFHTSGLAIAVTGSGSVSVKEVLARMWSPNVILLLAGIVCLIVISGLIVYLLERRKNDQHFGYGFWSGWGVGIWWSLVTMTTVGYGDTVPKTMGGRVLASIWMLTGVILVAAFTAAIVSVFTLSQLHDEWSGPEDLPRARVATVNHSSAKEYLDDKSLPHHDYPTLRDALTALRMGKHDVVVYDAPILRYVVLKEFGGYVRVLPRTFERQDYCIALPDKSPIREKCNVTLLETIRQEGWDKTLRHYLGVAD